MQIFGWLEHLGSTREELQHYRIIITFRRVEPIKTLLLIDLSHFVLSRTNKAPKMLDKRVCQCFDDEYDIQILGRTKIEAFLRKAKVAGRSSDQDIVIRVSCKM